jgi:hypothetical protein
MDRLRLTQVTASALSLWLGCLACVLGCVQPVSVPAPSTQRISELNATANEDDNDRMADSAPCCHHNGKSSEKNKQDSTNSSCWGLNATLTQKQDPVPPLRTFLSVFVLSLWVLHSSVPLSVSTDTSAPIAWHAGRDVLLQTHILPI